MAHTFESVMASLKARQFAPYYVLHGEEPFFTDKVTRQLEQHALPDAEKGFNQLVMYGKDADVGSIIQNARRYPMMAERQLVLVKEAQELSDLNRDASQKLLLQYFQKPIPSTLLVLSFKNKLDSRRAWVKEADKNGVVLNSERIKDYKLAQWITGYAKDEGLKLGAPAANMLSESIGNDLARIASELEKLTINLKPGQEITPDIVSRYVGISKEYNVFELQRALAERNPVKAYTIVNYFGANTKENPIIPIIAALFNYFVKVLMVHLNPGASNADLARVIGVNPYVVGDYVTASKVWPPTKLFPIISHLRIADCRSKGIDAGEMTEKQILQELVFFILH